MSFINEPGFLGAGVGGRLAQPRAPSGGARTRFLDTVAEGLPQEVTQRESSSWRGEGASLGPPAAAGVTVAMECYRDFGIWWSRVWISVWSLRYSEPRKGY